MSQAHGTSNRPLAVAGGLLAIGAYMLYSRREEKGPINPVSKGAGGGSCVRRWTRDTVWVTQVG